MTYVANAEHDELETREPRVTIRAVAIATAEIANIPVRVLLSHQRSAFLVHYRHAANWVCARMLQRSLPQIGNFFQRDHTSILHAVRRTQEKIDIEGPFGRTAMLCREIYDLAEEVEQRPMGHRVKPIRRLLQGSAAIKGSNR